MLSSKGTGAGERGELVGGHQFLNLTFMRADERARGRLIEDLTFKEGNWEEVENEGELTDSQQWDEKRKKHCVRVCGCVCVGE